MEKVELKPCPFCGGEAVLLEDGERYYRYQVACCNCGIRVVAEHISTDAISAWNRWATHKTAESMEQED